MMKAILTSLGLLVVTASQHLVSAAASPGVTVFYENDGNWTAFATNPSALFINEPASQADANTTCASYGETLLPCDSFADHVNSFSYQEYLGAVSSDSLFWSSCSTDEPVDSTGTAQNSSSSTSFPFLCTNTAPLPNNTSYDFATLPRVSTSYNGTNYKGMRDYMSFRFAGIPFVQPPIGDLRFLPAVPLNSTSSVDATSYRPACPQFGYFNGDAYGLNPFGNDEDCLYLNVYTPYLPSTNTSTNGTLKPVMVWFHGGGNTQGSSADLTFDGAPLSSRSDVVVVTTNYRLNIFGCLTLQDDIITGNQALSDKIEALRWVKQNIAGFGGDPDQVTIFGQSAGGGSVITLISAAPIMGEDLFQNAIIQSGHSSVVSSESVANASMPYIEALCPNVTGTERLSCLQDLSTDTLLNVTLNVTSWGPVVDGIYLLEYPQSQWAMGPNYINSVNMMAGNMMEEFQALATTTLAPNMTNFTEAVLTNLTADKAITSSLAAAILDSGLYLVTNDTVTNGSTTYSSVYNASVHIGTESGIVCPGTELYQISAAARAFKSQWQYAHQRAYALSYYDFYDLCTFPVGEPDTPYYRCHSGDLYEVFGTYYIYGQPVRVPEDIYYTNAIQDMFAWFARTGSPNVETEYLQARNYTSTIDFFDGFEWEPLTVRNQKLASFQWPGAEMTDLLYQEHCDLVEKFQTYS